MEDGCYSLPIRTGQRQSLKNGFQQRHNLNISGSTENRIIIYQEVLMISMVVVRYANDNNKVYNIRMNYDYSLAKWLKLETKLSYDNMNVLILQE
jgi:hypothetical protein